jgi:DNA-binding response OmpR family regulator
MAVTTSPIRTTPTSNVRRRGTASVVLIAEDDPIMATLLSDFLRSRGFATLVAVDAMQTVMYALRADPAIILLDVNMPGGSGLHALRKLRANEKTARLPVFAISGSQDRAVQSSLFDLGVDVFLAKPVDLEGLNQRIRGRLESVALSA